MPPQKSISIRCHKNTPLDLVESSFSILSLVTNILVTHILSEAVLGTHSIVPILIALPILR